MGYAAQRRNQRGKSAAGGGVVLKDNLTPYAKTAISPGAQGPPPEAALKETESTYVPTSISRKVPASS